MALSDSTDGGGKAALARVGQEPDIDPQDDPAYMSTAAAAKSLGIDYKKLWRLAKKHGLSPYAESARRVYWRRAEIAALGGQPVAPTDAFVVSRAEAAARLVVCPETVSRMVADGRLARPAIKNGRIFFREADVQKAVAKRDYDYKMTLWEAAALIGIKWFELSRLWRDHLFPKPYYADGRFRHGDVAGWWAEYRAAGHPTENPAKTKHINSLQPAWVYKKVPGISL